MKKFFWIGVMTVIGLALVPVHPGNCECVDPPAGLSAWWPLDKDAQDIAGMNHGSLLGTPSFPAGMVDQALSLDGKDDYLTTLPVINGWAAGTIDLWVRFNSLGNDPARIFSSLGPAGETPNYLVQMWADQTGFSFGFCTDETNPCTWHLAKTAAAPVVNQWYHLAGTWGSGAIKLYVDGVWAGTSSFSGVAPATIGSNWIGASVAGLIDEVEIFNRALDLEEIQKIYRAGEEGKCKNQPPVARCKNVTVSAGPSCTAEATVDDGSYDPDGDPITLSLKPAGPYPLGSTTVTLTVTDDKGASASCQARVTVVDDTPPEITLVTASPGTLWPPNHQMVPVRVTVNASDNCTSPPQCGIVSAASSEPINGLGDGDTAPDWEFFPGRLIANIRAERSGKGDGRFYTIGVQCRDAAGNISAPSTVKVRVPHDQRAPRDPGKTIRKKGKAPR